jgi:hypothetical protein
LSLLCSTPGVANLLMSARVARLGFSLQIQITCLSNVSAGRVIRIEHNGSEVERYHVTCAQKERAKEKKGGEGKSLTNYMLSNVFPCVFITHGEEGEPITHGRDGRFHPSRFAPQKLVYALVYLHHQLRVHLHKSNQQPCNNIKG